MSLSAAKERLQKNAVIIAARQAVYMAVAIESCNEVAVGDITKVITKGTTPKTYGFEFAAQGVPFLRAEEVADGEVLYEKTPYYIDEKTNDFMNRSQTCPGDILITIAGSIGRAAVVPQAAPTLNMNQAVAIVRCNEEVNPYFIYHMIQSRSVQEQILGSTVTSAISNLSLGKIKELTTPLPPRSEQDAIARFLEAVRRNDRWSNLSTELPNYLKHLSQLVARIEELAAKIAEARGLRSLAVKEVEGFIVASRVKIFEEASRSGTTRFDNVATLERGKFSHRPRNDPRFFGGDHPWIQIAEIEASGKYIREWTQTLNDDGLLISRKFPKGTLLISIAATIGAVGILDFDCCIPDSIVAVTPKTGVDSEYMYHYLCYLRSNLEQIAPQSAQKNINLRILEPLPIPALPLPEQRRIVAYLDNLQAKVDALKQLQAETAAELNALLPSILAKAFKGEL